MLSMGRLCFFSSLTRLPSCVTSRTAAAAGATCGLQQQRGYSSPPPGVRVLYDGLCPICVTEIRFLQYLQKNQPGKVDFIDIAVPGYDASKYKDVTFEKAMEEMHVIDENNVVHRGVPAFAVMYGAVGLGWLGRLMMWSPVRPFMNKAYDIFAKNRLKWTGRGDKCSTGRCE
ncbi:uncharacterized protein At5g50100, chloroplastic-like [Gouania willdenowi]|uniref:uncharacterized protein At5g50100, chloroplastic-like n=1 Tax=Gouania willdenowi TaxID=441366 RepID=UPI0010557836|nr:uncharacterized protein At5g50100, chloroplastic-like [Gouania willdenowi]